MLGWEDRTGKHRLEGWQVNAASFNPYSEWLGIVGAEESPHYYLLLGVPLFCEDGDEIEEAYLARCRLVQSRAAEGNAPEVQLLLEELTRAYHCLIQSEKKLAYDDRLRVTLTPAELSQALSCLDSDDSKLPLSQDSAAAEQYRSEMQQSSEQPRQTERSSPQGAADGKTVQPPDFGEPSESSETEWYYLAGEEVVGPFGTAQFQREVKQGNITEETHVWQPGWLQRKWAREIFPSLGATRQADSQKGNIGSKVTSPNYPNSSLLEDELDISGNHQLRPDQSQEAFVSEKLVPYVSSDPDGHRFAGRVTLVAAAGILGVVTIAVGGRVGSLSSTWCLLGCLLGFFFTLFYSLVLMEVKVLMDSSLLYGLRMKLGDAGARGAVIAGCVFFIVLGFGVTGAEIGVSGVQRWMGYSSDPSETGDVLRQVEPATPAENSHE